MRDSLKLEKYERYKKKNQNKQKKDLTRPLLANNTQRHNMYDYYYYLFSAVLPQLLYIHICI